MNTKTVTIMELSHINPNYRRVAATIEIANRAITALASRGRMRAGEIAEAIGEAGLNWEGKPSEVNAQQVGTVMRKLVSIGRVKREEVEGEPIEITVPVRYHQEYSCEKNDWITIVDSPAHQKTITPKISYYSLV